jgi:outer membrane immunogenic protein
MTRILLSTAALVAMTATAMAADLPRRTLAPAPVVAVAPVFTWSGFYVGLSGGGMFGETRVTTTGVLPGNIANVTALARPPRVTFDNDGFLIGGTAGYNMQFGAFVAGIEGDISYTDIDSRTTYLNPAPFGVGSIPAGSTRSTFRTDMDYLATVRGRVGVAFDRVLVYATGGVAFADTSLTADFGQPVTGVQQFFGRSNDTQVGYTVGGGVETAITNAVSLKAEYLYYDLGTTTVNVPAVGAGGAGAYNSRFDQDGFIIRGGANFRFGGF